ncbi:MAG: MgtC/SapB family protein [Bryobacteraceae bacterium]
MEFPNLDWSHVQPMMMKIAACYLMALPVGWEREWDARTAGIRTFPLVTGASCGYMPAGESLAGSEVAARLMEGVMTGIGFIGGGAILKDNMGVHGTATAASIWIIGAVGISVSQGRYYPGLLMSAITFLTLRLPKPFKRERQ